MRVRRDPADAAGYARIKTELAAADRHDRPAYRAGKASFIEAVLARLSAVGETQPTQLE